MAIKFNKLKAITKKLIEYETSYSVKSIVKSQSIDKVKVICLTQLNQELELEVQVKHDTITLQAPGMGTMFTGYLENYS